MDKSLILINLDTGEEFAVTLPAVIGRSREADIRLHDPGVSRRHAEITASDHGIQITDLESANGVIINGSRINGPALLHDGDIVIVGSSRLKVKASFSEPQTETVILQSISSGEKWHVDSRRLQVLYDIAVCMAEYEDVEQLLKDFFESLADLMKFDRHFVMTLDETGKLSAIYPAGAEDLPLSSTIAEKVMVSGETLLLQDAMTDSAFEAQESIMAFGIHSAICAPLRFRNRVFGFVYIDRKIAGSFSIEDMRLVRAAAFIIGPILENIRLRKEIEARYHETLSSLKETESRLINMERLAGFASLAQSVAHEIRNPLMIAGGLLERIKCNGSDDERRKIARALNAIKKIDGILHEVDAFVTLRPAEKKLVNVKILLESYMDGLCPELESRGLKCHLNASGKYHLALLDKKLFLQAMDLILRDIFERPPADGVLEISLIQSEGSVEIIFGEMEQE